MNINFNDLPWHDANLQSIYIDRQKPGEQDNVKLLIDWPDGKCPYVTTDPFLPDPIPTPFFCFKRPLSCLS
jgi:hypothetical protein